MKLVLFLHELALGGTSINAIELAAKLRDALGYEVLIFAPPGPMLPIVERSGLRYVPAPEARVHPCLRRIRALRALVRTEHPDLVYVWETWALLDAFYGVHLPMRVPILLTDMQMFAARILPRSVPTTFGTIQLVETARKAGIRDVRLLVPPVDLEANRPGTHDALSVRIAMEVEPNEILLVIVSRLVHTMKAESLHLAIDAVERLGRNSPIRLLIVGDGPARRELEARAASVNETLNRKAILLPGAWLDPRPAYAAADIVVGMGSSALRGMAYGKPVIIVGEGGFASTLTRESMDYFHYHGLFGKGRGAIDAGCLRDAIAELADSLELRQSLGAFSLEYVQQYYSLEVVSKKLGQICEDVVKTKLSMIATLGDSIRTGAIYLRERRFLWRASRAAPTQLLFPEAAVSSQRAGGV